MGTNDKPGTDRPCGEEPDDKGLGKDAVDDEFDMDEDAPTVIMQKAIDPAVFATPPPDAEDTHIIDARNTKGGKKMSEEELNRIVDEVGKFGAMPMDRLPSEVGKNESSDDDEKTS